MQISASSAALQGLANAQAQYSAAATTIASGGGDLVDGVVNASTAQVQVAVNTHLLKAAMDQDKHLIDVLVH